MLLSAVLLRHEVLLQLQLQVQLQVGFVGDVAFPPVADASMQLDGLPLRLLLVAASVFFVLALAAHEPLAAPGYVLVAVELLSLLGIDVLAGGQIREE